jgi:hypothetical protein
LYSPHTHTLTPQVISSLGGRLLSARVARRKAPPAKGKSKGKEEALSAGFGFAEVDSRDVAQAAIQQLQVGGCCGSAESELLIAWCLPVLPDSGWVHLCGGPSVRSDVSEVFEAEPIPLAYWLPVYCVCHQV